MNLLLRRLLLLLIARIARRQAWRLARRVAGKKIKCWVGKQVHAVPRRSTAWIAHVSAIAISKSPLHHTDTGKQIALRLFALAARLRQN
jgi:hypothetical protein